MGLAAARCQFVNDMLHGTWRFASSAASQLMAGWCSCPCPSALGFCRCSSTTWHSCPTWQQQVCGVPPIRNVSAAFVAGMTLAQVPQPVRGCYAGHSTRSRVAAICRGLIGDIEVVAGVAGWGLRSTAIYKDLQAALPTDAHGFCLSQG